MKKKDIQIYLQHYYSIRQYALFRLIHDDNSIGKFKQFLDTLKDNVELTGAQYLTLAGVILGKKKRYTSLRASARTFKKMESEIFGGSGVSILDKLVKGNVLNETMLLICVKHRNYSHVLAEVYFQLEERGISKKGISAWQNIAMSSDSAINLISLCRILVSRYDISKAALKQSLIQEEAFLENILALYSSLLQAEIPCSIEDITNIADEKSAVINDFVSYLSNTTPPLLTASILAELIKIINCKEVSNLFRQLEPDEMSLRCLFDMDPLLPQAQKGMLSIIEMFKAQAWSIGPYLRRGCQNGEQCLALSVAIKEVIICQFEEQFNTQILDILFDEPGNYHISSANLFGMLHRLNLVNATSLAAIKLSGSYYLNKLLILLSKAEPESLLEAAIIEPLFLKPEKIKEFYHACKSLNSENKLLKAHVLCLHNCSQNLLKKAVELGGESSLYKGDSSLAVGGKSCFYTENSSVAASSQNIEDSFKKFEEYCLNHGENLSRETSDDFERARSVSSLF